MTKGMGSVGVRGKHVVVCTEQEKASQHPRTSQGQKPMKAKGFRDWGEVNAIFQNRGAALNG